MATVLQPYNVSRTIVDIIKPQLALAIADVSYQLKDPEVATRQAPYSAFVLTAYPKKWILYPHVILEEVGTSGARVDMRETMHQHATTIRFQVLTKNKTHAFNIMGGLREFIERRHNTLSSLGLHDIRVVGSSALIPSDDETTFTQTMTIEALVYSMYSP